MTVKTKKPKANRLPSIRVYFVDNGDMRKLIEKDAKNLGVSISVMANMFIKAGRPLVVKSLEEMNRKSKSIS